MPPANPNLDVNVEISVSKRFITNTEVRNILQDMYDWNSPGLSFKGRTVARATVRDRDGYEVILDDVPDYRLKLSAGCMKYLSSNDNISINSEHDAFTGDESEEEIDLTASNGWTTGEVYVDSRLDAADGYVFDKSRFNMDNFLTSTPFDYFLYFLPTDHFKIIVDNINTYARSVGSTWADVTYPEYMMWIALLTVMTVIQHSDRKAYWHLGTSYFKVSINFTKYMPMKRFNDIMRMHVFEVPSKEKQVNDPLYQIRATLDAFNDHLKDRLTPGKYLIIDETINQWLDIGMPNLKKSPHKLHLTGQEFKSLVDCHTNAIVRLDTVSNPRPKEYDNDFGMRNSLATAKRLVMPWFSSGRTIIADSWFGSPDMVSMLNGLGLYSIMHLTKRKCWSRGIPSIDVFDQAEEAHDSYYTIRKTCENGRNIFVCAYRDLNNVKAFISSCSTTRLKNYRSVEESSGETGILCRPQVVEEYETHKSKPKNNNAKNKHFILAFPLESVDIVNNCRSNLISYHDVVSTERWEMRFLGFILDICETNAFNCYKVFAKEGDRIVHNVFKDHMAYSMLKYCERLACSNIVTIPCTPVSLRSNTVHMYISMKQENTNKRRRLVCQMCRNRGVHGTRVEKRCSCDPTTPMCKTCHYVHLREVFQSQTYLNNSL
jgi:hypothetical protein